ncbi:acetate--CoA ligase [archaeon]|jgi:acetyl-CoA synthetase|nr:acetate--CoA ligase [archaeon]
MAKYVIKKSNKLVPSDAMKKIAHVKNKNIYKQAAKNPIKFWEKLATEGLDWEKKWTKAYEQKLPYFKWFKGGKINFSKNCLDRHLENKSDKVAITWVPEPTKEKTIKLTYKELHEKVCKFANVLKKHKIKKGDVVSIYLPMIPEAIIAMLACTRIGAIHSVVFSAFSADALKARIQDGKAKILITADGYYRRGEKEDLLTKARRAVKSTTVNKVIIVPRLRKKIPTGRKFLNFNKELESAEPNCEPTIVNSEDTMFILYTSGTTGKPKGVVHDTGGYATQAYWTAKWNFNLHDDDVMWCTADVGWVTGHTYAFYGPLLNGATTLIYEGSPDFPNPGRWWKIIQDNKVTVFYTAPTAIRMFQKFDPKYIKKHNLKSLRILGSVGEPIDEDAWKWYFKTIGGSRCPIIDTWWQTETGGTLINALPGIGPFVPKVSGQPFPGTNLIIVDEKGKQIKKKNVVGNLVQVPPLAPGMLHGVWKNPKKYKDTYWSRFKKYYDTSDGAFLTNGGLIRITGRTDDVMKVAGHRMTTAELENAITDHQAINETAVVPIPHEVKGEVPVAFVILKHKIKDQEKFEKEIKKLTDDKIGPTARPAKIYIVEALPKTRSGKIMRRILKALLIDEEPKGLSTLLNPKSVDAIKKIIKTKK